MRFDRDDVVLSQIIAELYTSSESGNPISRTGRPAWRVIRSCYIARRFAPCFTIQGAHETFIQIPRYKRLGPCVTRSGHRGRGPFGEREGYRTFTERRSELVSFRVTARGERMRY